MATNWSSYSTPVSATVTSPSGGGSAVAWNPGHWMRFTPSGQGAWYYAVHRPPVMTELLRQIDDIVGLGLKGGVVNISPASFITGLGTYNFTYTDQIYNKFANNGMRVIFCLITETQFGQANGNYGDSDTFPAFMLASPTTYLAGRQPNNIYDDLQVAWWRSASNDVLTAAYAALGARYNGAAKWEAFGITSETSFVSYLYNSSTPDSALTYANMLSKWTLLAQAYHAAFPNKMGMQLFNGLNSNTGEFELETHQEYLAVAQANNIAWANPNFGYTNADDSQIALVGMNYSGQLPGAGSSFTNYSARIPVFIGFGEDNDYYGTSFYGPVLGTPWMSPTNMWNAWTTGWSASSRPNGPFTGPHGSHTYALGSPQSMPYPNASHFIWLYNNGRGGDNTNQWPYSGNNNAGQLRSFITARLNSLPAYAAPTCFGGSYVTGG